MHAAAEDALGCAGACFGGCDAACAPHVMLAPDARGFACTGERQLWWGSAMRRPRREQACAACLSRRGSTVCTRESAIQKLLVCFWCSPFKNPWSAMDLCEAGGPDQVRGCHHAGHQRVRLKALRMDHIPCTCIIILPGHHRGHGAGLPAAAAARPGAAQPGPDASRAAAGARFAGELALHRFSCSPFFLVVRRMIAAG